MTLKQIEYFLKVCELKQISECSEHFGISQSAMSIAIKNLEKSLGGNLFDRKGKSIIINERGKAFLNSITPIYNRVLEIQRNMRNASMYDIFIASSQNIGNYLLPWLLSDLIKNSPDTNLNVKIQNTEEIIQCIKNNVCDIGLVEDDIIDKDVTFTKICKDELIIVTGNKELEGKTFNVEEIAKKDWIIREKGSGTRNILFKNLPKNTHLNIVLELSSTEAIKRSVRNNDLFTCLPKFALKCELGNGLYEVKLKDVSFTRNLYLAHAKDKDKNSRFMDITESLLNKIKTRYDELTL
ncbi:transcriptional regulator, LysR family [Campylobacter blaseri]|uniref:HTH lysR-type domain-containing protein n=1 Tax=Campylobacter blaseri TaxID=2042961 RepID=A0A2P8R1F2_9BACT|nr:LysR substrate-binding domain-containing protein [Campylobacter blaseri]PSM52322.1 hypothetical protein CQ405_04520 [Campylobacter blaseri]PSM54088.1 hypothetical protein CRN67_04520 [Campylobacter blaseri]QKF85530.1 transcriptional regulator, LysR family [Campylobacter blaseri]